MKHKPELMIQIYRTMFLIRHFEEMAIEFKARKIISGLLHLYIGEEGIATGVCAALRPDDYISRTHH